MEKKALTVIGRSTNLDLDHRMRTTGLVMNEIFFILRKRIDLKITSSTHVSFTYIFSMKKKTNHETLKF